VLIFAILRYCVNSHVGNKRACRTFAQPTTLYRASFGETIFCISKALYLLHFVNIQIYFIIMTKFTQLLLCLLVAQWLPAQSVVYVRSVATGANNGTSWDNAYTQLDAALDNFQPGQQIWVAKGTYVAADTILDVSFNLVTGMKIYGGFAGSESSLSQRNIGLNATILSGDRLGNDVDGDFSVNRSDNRLHVIKVAAGSNPADAVIIDGFFIEGGNASVVAADPAEKRRGAGIYAVAPFKARNCNFNNNRADSGASIMVPVTAGSGMEVYNCVFEKNSTTVRAAGIYFLDLTSATIRKCVFQDNVVVRGAIYPRTSTNVTIDSCDFINNTNGETTGYGTGIFSWQASIDVTNSNFLGNTAGNATCIYIDNRERGKFANIKKCRFENNQATDYGGTGVFSFKQDYNMEDCVFLNNTAANSAAAIYNSDTTNFTVKNTTFEGHSASWASAVANYGSECSGTFDGCTFKLNNVTNGGTSSNGFRAQVGYKNCIFDSNNGRIGAALFSQNDTTQMRIENCTFTNNNAVESGGCIFKNPGVKMWVHNSLFFANGANIGGAAYASGDSTFLIENTIIRDNIAIEQAAGVFLSGTPDAHLTNCLIARNLNISASTAAGGIGNNAGAGEISTLTLINCTIADNLAPIGAGISQWQDADTSSATLYIQNCVLQNPEGKNYEIEAGNPIVISLGGNQSSDDTAIDYLNEDKDVHMTSNAFVDAENSDYHLASLTVPALDGGVANGAPATDLEGNPRQGPPDSGCYELGTNGVFGPASNVESLAIAPNPANNMAVITIEHAWAGDAILEVVALDGRVVSSTSVTKNAGKWQHNLNVEQLPVGTYRIQLRGERTLFGGNLVVAND
jgi:hypothetical protein